MNTPNDLQGIAAQITSLTKAADTLLKGKEATIKSRWAGKYRGRLGRVDGAIPHHEHGLSVLVMIYALGDEKRVLNSDPRTRSYWPLNQIEIAQ